MTTLSKEDVVRMAESLGWSLDAIEVDDMFAFATLARADLVAENERLRDEDDARYTHSCGPKCMRAGCVNRRLRTALAAAEARETKLREAIDVVLSDTEECEDHDGWLANLVSCEAINQIDEAFNLPRDDSALREMIAGVYEECEQACRRELLVENLQCDDDVAYNLAVGDCMYNIRALAEKARHGN